MNKVSILDFALVMPNLISLKANVTFEIKRVDNDESENVRCIDYFHTCQIQEVLGLFEDVIILFRIECDIYVSHVYCDSVL